MLTLRADEAAGLSLCEPESPLRDLESSRVCSQESQERSHFHREVAAACDGVSRQGCQDRGGLRKKDTAVRRLAKAERESFLRRYRDGTGERAPSRRDRLQQIVTSARWMSFVLFAILVDSLTAVICWDSANVFQDMMSILVTIVFVLDIGVRIYVFSPGVFFLKFWNIIDTLIVALSVYIEALVQFGMATKTHQSQSHSLLWLVQVARVVRWIRLSMLTRRLCPALRRVTGENKRRFVDVERDFDLDLVHITPRLIGMSVPAAGVTVWLYRNPLHEVVRFFETFHARHYKIVNMCPELPYPVTDFTTGVVECFDVEDHTPPRLEQVVKFLELAEVWMSGHADNVLAVHCRGGKGRTGSFCCAWLLYTREAEDAEDALNYFAMRRTDTDHFLGRHKVQGVETPSQVRYVQYVDQLLRTQRRFYPQPVSLPTPVRLELLELRLGEPLGPAAPRELVAVVHDRNAGPRRAVHVSGVATSIFDMVRAVVAGDVLIEVYRRDDLPPGEDFAQHCWLAAEPGGAGDPAETARGTKPAAILFFCFHTSFVDGSVLRLEESAIDRVSKSTSWKTSSGYIELSFSVL